MNDLPLCPSCHAPMFHVIDDVYTCRDHRIYRVNGKYVGELGQSVVVGQDDVAGFNHHDMWISSVTRYRQQLHDIVDGFTMDDLGFAIDDARRLLRRWEE